MRWDEQSTPLAVWNQILVQCEKCSKRKSNNLFFCVLLEGCIFPSKEMCREMYRVALVCFMGLVFLFTLVDSTFVMFSSCIIGMQLCHLVIYLVTYV